MLGTLEGRTEENSQPWGMGHLPPPTFVPGLSGQPGWSAHPPDRLTPQIGSPPRSFLPACTQAVPALSLECLFSLLHPLNPVSPEGPAPRLLLREAFPWLLCGGVIISPGHIPTSAGAD